MYLPLKKYIKLFLIKIRLYKIYSAIYMYIKCIYLVFVIFEESRPINIELIFLAPSVDSLR